jgi:hypothetical protein
MMPIGAKKSAVVQPTSLQEKKRISSEYVVTQVIGPQKVRYGDNENVSCRERRLRPIPGGPRRYQSEHEDQAFARWMSGREARTIPSQTPSLLLLATLSQLREKTLAL